MEAKKKQASVQAFYDAMHGVYEAKRRAAEAAKECLEGIMNESHYVEYDVDVTVEDGDDAVSVKAFGFNGCGKPYYVEGEGYDFFDEGSENRRKYFDFSRPLDVDIMIAVMEYKAAKMD